MRSSRRSLMLVLMSTAVACGPTESGGEADMGAVETGEMDHSQHGGDAPATRQEVHLTSAQERALGVAYMTVARRDLSATIRTVGTIEANESLVVDVTPKVEGFVEELYVSTTGATVRPGDPLLTLYSPELVAAQEEVLTATRLMARVDPAAEAATADAASMLAAARRRLEYWDITEAQIDRLVETGEVTKTLTLVSPVNGIVLEKHVNEGQRVTPGLLLYRVVDLSEIWVEGDVFERDVAKVRMGAEAHIEVSAFPGEHLMGRVDFIYPTVDEISRTSHVRILLANPGARLKPGMFATIFFDVVVATDEIAVPLEAVIVTGERNLVFVRSEDGVLQPRQVVLGGQAGDHVQILAGLEEGETIVAAANFLVDAESRLGTTGGGMPGMSHGAMEPDSTADAPADAAGHTHD